MGLRGRKSVCVCVRACVRVSERAMVLCACVRVCACVYRMRLLHQILLFNKLFKLKEVFLPPDAIGSSKSKVCEY